jgi:hypothetical protein
MMLNAMPVVKRKPAIVQTDVPQVSVNFANAHGNTPLNNTAMRSTASNSVTAFPNRLFARVYSTERR